MSTLENKLSAFGIAHEYAKVAISLLILRDFQSQSSIFNQHFR